MEGEYELSPIANAFKTMVLHRPSQYDGLRQFVTFLKVNIEDLQIQEKKQPASKSVYSRRYSNSLQALHNKLLPMSLLSHNSCEIECHALDQIYPLLRNAAISWFEYDGNKSISCEEKETDRKNNKKNDVQDCGCSDMNVKVVKENWENICPEFDTIEFSKMPENN